MKNMLRKLTSYMIVLSFALISMAAVAPNVSAATTTFYFQADNDLTTSQPASGTQSIAGLETEAFILKPAASITFAFEQADTFVVGADLGGAGTATVTLGVSADGSTCDTTGQTSAAFSQLGATPGTANLNPGVSGLTVPAGQYLCLTWAAGAQADTIALGADSFFTTADTDPGYPTPSIATIVLLSLGLVMVAGVVYARKKQA